MAAPSIFLIYVASAIIDISEEVRDYIIEHELQGIIANVWKVGFSKKDQIIEGWRL